MNKSELVNHVREGWLPLPRSIVPPERPFFLWKELPEPFLPMCTLWRSLKGVEEVDVWASGGIDSRTALLLAAETLGPENVIAARERF